MPAYEFQVNRFMVHFMGAMGTVGESAGWIELFNGSRLRGLIYLMNTADDQNLPHDYMSLDNSYIVMHQRTKYLDAFLTVLKGAKPLNIEFSNGATALVSPNTSKAVDEDSPEAEGLKHWEELMRGTARETRQTK